MILYPKYNSVINAGYKHFMPCLKSRRILIHLSYQFYGQYCSDDSSDGKIPIQQRISNDFFAFSLSCVVPSNQNRRGALSMLRCSFLSHVQKVHSITSSILFVSHITFGIMKKSQGGDKHKTSLDSHMQYPWNIYFLTFCSKYIFFLNFSTIHHISPN